MRYTDEEILLTLEGRNGEEFNHLKAIEELSELVEVLIKKITKRGGTKEPSDRSVIEEIGDVNLRLRILEYEYGVDLVRKREQEKLLKWAEYIDTNRYTHI